MKNKLLLPALILQYAAIDAMANLDRAEDKDSATRSDFIAWVDEFLLAGASLDVVTAAELYSARCGLVHAYSFESGMTKRGEAREVFYSVGTADHDAFKWAAKVGSRKFAPVKIELLISAFNEAVRRFQRALEKDPDLSHHASPPWSVPPDVPLNQSPPR